MSGDAFLFWVAVAVVAGLFLGAFTLWGRWIWGLFMTYAKDWRGARTAEAAQDYETMRKLRSRVRAEFYSLIIAAVLSVFGWFGLFLLFATLSGHATWHW
jgi:hypothetical protein